MAKVLTILAAVVSLVFVAPVIESGTTSSVDIFQAVGNAESGGGE